MVNRQKVTNLRLPGQYDERLLSSLGLQGPYYNWNRWYLPGVGRYLELDPVATKGEFNGWFAPDWYNYALGNPLRYEDPEGLKPWAVCYTRCIDKLAPGFSSFFVGSQLAANGSYELGVEITETGGIRLVLYSILPESMFPNICRAARALSRVALRAQAVVFPYVAGASYGCMLSCGMNSNNW